MRYAVLKLTLLACTLLLLDHDGDDRGSPIGDMGEGERSEVEIRTAPLEMWK